MATKNPSSFAKILHPFSTFAAHKSGTETLSFAAQNSSPFSQQAFLGEENAKPFRVGSTKCQTKCFDLYIYIIPEVVGVFNPFKKH